jgi:TolB protein
MRGQLGWGHGGWHRRRVPRTGLALLALALTLAGCGTPLPTPGPGTPAPVRVAEGGLPGRLLFVRGGNLWVWANNQETQLTTDGTASEARWSPDGAAILYTSGGDSYDDLYVADAQGKNARALTANQAKGVVPNSLDYVRNSYFLTGPTWGRLPNGADRIVYSTDRNGMMALWLMNGVNGKPQPVLGTQNLPDHIEGAALAPDANMVAFTYDMTDDKTGVRATQIFSVNLSTGQYSELTAQPGGAYDAAWSPDGKWLAYAARDANSGITSLWTMRADGSGARKLIDSGSDRDRAPVWSPDGNQLAFVRLSGSDYGLYSVNLTMTAIGPTADKPQAIGRYTDINAAAGVSWVR